MTRVVALAAATAVVATWAPVAPSAGAARIEARYAKPGPYAAGVTTLDVNGTRIEVWYPSDTRSVKGHKRDRYFVVDWLPPKIKALIPTAVNPPFVTDAFRDVPPSHQGPFPLVTFAHGFGGYRDQSTFLTTHLASWGFVVAAPDLPESGLAVTLGQPVGPPGSDLATLRMTVDTVRAASARSTGVLSGTVRRGKVAAIGHSMGARASIQFANDREVATYIALDGTTNSLPDNAVDRAVVTPPDKPSMYIGASGWLLPDYEAVPGAKRLVLETQATHMTAFTDVCRIGEREGGLLQIARRLNSPSLVALLEKFTERCVLGPGLLPPARVQPVIQHYVTAQLRATLGIDKHPIGLSASSERAFHGVNVQIFTGAYVPPNSPF